MASGSLVRRSACIVSAILALGVVQPLLLGPATAEPTSDRLRPVIGKAAAFDVSPAARDVARQAPVPSSRVNPGERGQAVRDTGFTGDGAVQSAVVGSGPVVTPAANFDGIQNNDNPFQVSPPDPDGDVGPNHYVQMVNISFAIFSKTGTELVPPTPLGNLWAGFAINDCTDDSGDPIVLHDQLADRWILTQFTTAGPNYWNCIAISTTPDPTGTYYRYAFSTGNKFPDYPKYGVWPDAYYISTREFGAVNFTGVGAYALERAAMIAGNPNARFVKFNLAPGTTPYLPGDGLLPTDLDGDTLPPAGTPNFFVGTQDDGGPYGAPSDAINMWEFSVEFVGTPSGTFTKTATLPVPAFDSIFPCGADGRSCIAQPGVAQKIDILSYRQRPTWRLAYRNMGTYEALVTNQSVEAAPNRAGVRWYEIRSPNSAPVLRQAATYAPNDGVNRWMGSIAMDGDGNMALGYSVSNGTTVFPGIRYTGRLAGDPVNTFRPIELVLRAGTGSQTGSPRWGDYTAMHVDPTDDCTFWYTNEYYAANGLNWQTRIGSFKIPSCN